jgi:hypothetical protein
VPIDAVKGGDQDERSSSRVKLGLSILRDRARSDEHADPGGHDEGCKCAKNTQVLRMPARGAGRRTTKSEIRDNILGDAVCAILDAGGMAEWSMAVVLKTGSGDLRKLAIFA